jgi:two-component system sensor histidine kinase CpxA
MLHTSNPSRYWVGVRVRMADFDQLGQTPMTLLAVSNSIRGGGLFFDFVPWVVVGFGCLLVSVLFWLPLVGGMTRSLSQITRATEQIAEGRFDARVAADRRDELGRLGQAINQMASRLAGFVSGQKRFLGDIAHELCSPIARIQMALGILEQRADEKQKVYVEDLREEIQQMSCLVNELLSFSKASLEPAAVRLQSVRVRSIVEKAVRREGVSRAEVRMEVGADVSVLAEPELLVRSLSNLVRNAIRYAGEAGPITISARREDGSVVISVADCGPGVPEESLSQLFDPFYRTEPSRTRESGGTGLGLAIVKTCVESCQGKVRCRNRQPSGLEVLITLREGRSAAEQRASA